MSADMVMRYSVDLNAPLVPRMANTLFVSGDNMANTIEAVLTKDGKELDASGYTCVLKMTRPDGEVPEMAGKVDENVLTVTMTSDFYAFPGHYTAKLKLINAQTGERKTVLVLYGEILDDGGMPTIIPGNKLPEDIEAMLAMMEELREATADARNAAQKANEAADGVDEKVAEANAELAGKVGQLSEELLTKAPAINCEASGALVSISDAAAQPAVSLISHIELVQEGEGDPSPDNVRPISGWDKLNAHRTNDNLLGGDYLADMLVDSASAVKDADAGIVTFKSSNANAFKWYGPFKANTQYTIVVYGKNTNNTAREANLQIIYTDGTRDFIWFQTAGDYSYSYIQSATGQGNQTQPNKTVKYIGGLFSLGSTELYYEKCGVFEGGIDSSDFGNIPVCDGQTLTADLPETVYGGTLDWGTGMLTVTSEQMTFTGNENWVAPTGGVTGLIFNLPIPRKKWGFNTSFCDRYFLVDYSYGGLYETVSGVYSNHPDNNNVYFRKPNESVRTLEDWKSYLQEQYAAGTPVQLCYELASPYTIQLTTQQLDMLKGINNVWSDSGDTELVYVADTKMYIDQKLAAIAAATLNN